MKAKKKGFSQLREEAMYAQVVEALKKSHPEFTVNESTFGCCYAMPYAWNNGKPAHATGSSMSISLTDGKVDMGKRVELIKEVYAHEKELQRAAQSPNGLMFVFFGIDNTIAFTHVEQIELYRKTKYDHYAVPVKNLTFVTKFKGEYANPEFS